MRGKVEELRQASQGAAQTVISKKMIADVNVPLPSLPEQQRIVEKLDALVAEINRLEAIYQQKLDDLAELKQSIMHKAFSGDLSRNSHRDSAK